MDSIIPKQRRPISSHLSVRKVGFLIQGTAPQEPGEIEGTLELIAKKDCGEEILGHIDFQLKVVEPALTTGGHLIAALMAVFSITL